MAGHGERGILTSRDEDYLRDPETYRDNNTAQAVSSTKRQIKERVAEAMQDFELLADEWDDEEIKDLFENFEKYLSDHDGSETQDSEDLGADMIEFLYRGFNLLCNDVDIFVGGNSESFRALAFRRVLSNGIKQGNAYFGEAPENVLIETNTTLYELPSDEEIRQFLTTKDQRQIHELIQETKQNFDDAWEEAPDPIPREMAQDLYHRQKIVAICRELQARKKEADEPIQRVKGPYNQKEHEIFHRFEFEFDYDR